MPRARMLAGRQGWLSPFGVSVISCPMEAQPSGCRLGSTGRYRSAPTHPQDPKPRLRSRGLLQDLSIWTLPPRGASQVDLAHRPQKLLAWSGSTVNTSLSWALGSQAPVAKSSSHNYLSWVPWAPTCPGARTRLSGGRQSNRKEQEDSSLPPP